MNRINAAEREKTAAEYESEAQRIRIVAVAKAEAESKKLQGQGIADQRREIAKGLEESVKMLNSANISSQEASALIIITQHYDTLHSIGASNRSNLVLLPNTPTSASTMLNDLVVSMAATQKMDDLAKPGVPEPPRQHGH
jgi:regulator of protease activity HflC (stomatin/prohibitin superfamily)